MYVELHIVPLIMVLFYFTVHFSLQYRHWFTSEIQFYIIRTSNCSVCERYFWNIIIFLAYIYFLKYIHCCAGEWCFEITKCHGIKLWKCSKPEKGKNPWIQFSVFRSIYQKKNTILSTHNEKNRGKKIDNYY